MSVPFNLNTVFLRIVPAVAIMRLSLAFLLFLVTTRAGLFAQVFPTENDTLNYRRIGFSFPAAPGVKNYKIEVASGRWKDEASFKKNIVASSASPATKVILQVPSFGSQYTWRVINMAAKPVAGKMRHFSTGFLPTMDTTNSRIRIIKAAEKYKDAYCIMDGMRTMYNMKGEPIWYLPDLRGELKENSQMRDLKLTSQNTFTFVADGNAYEVDYNGKIIWQGPNGRKLKADTLEGYHHEITRLSNGHYMALTFEPILKPTPHMRDSIRRKIATDTSGRRSRRPVTIRQQRYGVVREYDEHGTQVWSWEASAYFKNADMHLYLMPNGIEEFDVHMNSFWFDEKNSMLYVSFRNISQIFRISYPSGEVLNVYGKVKDTGDHMINHFFCGQHSVKVSEKGFLCVFNNGCDMTAPPRVIMMQQPGPGVDSLIKVWEFECPVQKINMNNVPRAAIQRGIFSSGGNVMELPDNSLFVSMCIPHCEMFIVGLDKQLMWEAIAKNGLPIRKNGCRCRNTAPHCSPTRRNSTPRSSVPSTDHQDPICTYFRRCWCSHEQSRARRL